MSFRRTLKHSSVIGASAALMVVAAGAPAATGAEAEAEHVTATVTGPQETLLLEFSGPGERVVIDDRANTVVWRGAATSARLPLPYSATADLVVASVDDNTPNALASVQATNPDPASFVTPLTSVTTTSDTTLSWGAIEGATSYDVLQGEHTTPRRTATVDDTRATVAASLGGTETYQVVSNPIEQPPTPEGDPQGPVSYRYGVEITPPTTQVQTLSPDAQVGDSVGAQAPEIITTENSYETFIPSQYIDAPEDPFDLSCEGSFGGPDWWYTGDDREVGYNTGEYRTRAVSNMLWLDAGTLSSKDVAPTSRYERTDDGQYRYDSTRQADSDGLQVRALSNDGDYARNVIEHEVGNPYCNSLAGISYANQQDVYQNGGHWIYGSHDKMPDHQFYRVDFVQQDPNNPGSPITEERDLVFHHELEDPTCLVGPVCGSWRYQYVR